MAVFGSRAGSKWHPDWYLNLLAHPDTAVETAEGQVRVSAAPRVIPVLVLERHG